MKKIFAFVIILLSISAYTQDLHPKSFIKHPRLESINEGPSKSDLMRSDYSRIFSESDPFSITEDILSQKLSIIQKVDSTYFWNLDLISFVWQKIFKYIDYEYDANYNLISMLYQSWDVNSWLSTSKFQSNFDLNNNLTMRTWLEWNGSKWINSSRYTYTYNANSYKTSSLFQKWNGISWENRNKDTITYDVNNNRLSQQSQFWINDIWKNSSLYTITYNNINNRATSLHQNWVDNTWVNSELSIYAYNSSNLVDSVLTQTWNGSTWENSDLGTSTYDENNNKIRSLGQYKHGTIWLDQSQILYTYDVKYNLTSRLYQDKNENEWLNFYFESFSYDGNNFLKGIKSKSWEMDGYTVAFIDSTQYYFQAVQGINDINGLAGNVAIYPNPSNGMFIIQSTLKINSIDVFTILGKRIKSIDNIEQTSQVLDLTDFNKGIYILKIYCGKEIFNNKVIIQN